jgi:hypothetical protein
METAVPPGKPRSSIDKHVQAPLTAIPEELWPVPTSRKCWSTTVRPADYDHDETTYVKESIQIPRRGTPITTCDFVPIDASIRQVIIPISAKATCWTGHRPLAVGFRRPAGIGGAAR